MRDFLQIVDYEKDQLAYALANAIKERDEAREALREWQPLRLWGAEPQHIHDFIKGQQTRIHESQDIEKTCEQLERERDEAREAADKWKKLHDIKDELFKKGIAEVERERDEARADRDIARFSDSAHDRLVGELAQALRERDEAREKWKEQNEALRTLAEHGENEIQKLTKELARITEAAQAVVDRWEQPAWKDTEPTATVIYRLRDALGREAE